MKKRIFVIALVASVLAVSLVGATSAYFTDTRAAVNVFTVGSVDIKFTEWDANKQQVEIAGTDDIIDYGTLYPGRVIQKNPTVTVTSNDSAFVAARIVITNDNAQNGSIPSTANITSLITDTNVMEFFSGGRLGDGNGVTIAKSVNYVSDYVEILVVVNSAVSKNGEFLVFENFTIPGSWNNAQMDICNGLEVTVEAYAVQTAGFEGQTAVSAVKTAFPTAFVNMP